MNLTSLDKSQMCLRVYLLQKDVIATRLPPSFPPFHPSFLLSLFFEQLHFLKADRNVHYL